MESGRAPKAKAIDPTVPGEEAPSLSSEQGISNSRLSTVGRMVSDPAHFYIYFSLGNGKKIRVEGASSQPVVSLIHFPNIEKE